MPTQQRDVVDTLLIESSIEIEAIVCRSILAAHLLIGDLAEAEKAVMEAIRVWRPEEEDGEQLFQATLRSAARRPIAPASAGSIQTNVADYFLPLELRRVLKLPPNLRPSFVLRFLLGLPWQVCAQILQMGVPQISEYCRAATKQLSALDA